MTLIEQIKADREKGTPGPWLCHLGDEAAICDCRYVLAEYGGMGSIANVSVAGSDEFPWGDDEGPDINSAKANARRIARVPDMEAALMSSIEALAPFAMLLKPHHEGLPDEQPIFGIEDSVITAGHLRAALAAYRKATEGENDSATQ